MLRATTACTFSTSQLPKVVRTPQFLTHFTSKCASRHNGVQLFISHLPRCLHTRRFSQPTFQPSGATKPQKNTMFRDFPTFSRTCIFFLLIFSLLTLLPADCFFICPYCRKFDFQTSFDYRLGQSSYTGLSASSFPSRSCSFTKISKILPIISHGYIRLCLHTPLHKTMVRLRTRHVWANSAVGTVSAPAALLSSVHLVRRR